MKQLQFIFLFFILVMSILIISCQCEWNSKTMSMETTQTTNANIEQSTTKIMSLQAVINDAEKGDVIDLSESKYNDITNYSATINKAVTIQNGNDLKGASLNVVSNGVVLEGIKKASVTTNSSMKISGSQLNNLSIASVLSPSSNTIIGRGETIFDNQNTNAVHPPVIEVSDSEVTENVSVAIENAYLTVKKITVGKTIGINAANVQLTINDKISKIKEIKTDKICQVVLEDGTSDTLPCSTDKIIVSGEGELKYINMKAGNLKQLLKLSVLSGMTTLMKENEVPDFSSLQVLGTYEQGEGITVFKPGELSYDMKETFSKIETNFIVKIGDTVYYNNNNIVCDKGLNVGTYTVTILTEYEKTTEDYQCSFEIAVIGERSLTDLTSDIIPYLSSIETDCRNVKLTYQKGEKLDLRGLMILGNYTGKISYKSIITNYDLLINGNNINNGYVLEKDTIVTVKCGVLTKSIMITVEEGHSFTFVPYQYNTSYNIVLYLQPNSEIEELTNFSRRGWTLKGWCSDVACQEIYEFPSVITEDTTVYANWEVNHYYITFDSSDGTGDMEQLIAAYNTEIHLPKNLFYKDGYTFWGWGLENDAEYPTYADGAIIRNLSETDGEIITLYAVWKEGASPQSPQQPQSSQSVAHYLVRFDANGGSGTMSDCSWDCDKSYYLPKCSFISPIGYKFGSWNTAVDGKGTSYSDEENVLDLTDDDGAVVTLYAQWVDKDDLYVTYLNTKNVLNPNIRTFKESQSVVLSDLSNMDGYSFDGWYEILDDITDTRTDGWIAGERNNNVILWAKWTQNVYNIEYVDVSDDILPEMSVLDCPTQHTYNTVTKLVNPTKQYRTFLGWFHSPDDSEPIMQIENTDITSDITLYAKWIDTSHYITYHLYDGTDDITSSFLECVPFDELPTPTKTGYVFDGWYDASSDVSAHIVTGWAAGTRTADVTLWASWSEPASPKYPQIYVAGFNNVWASNTTPGDCPAMLTNDGINYSITLKAATANPTPSGIKFATETGWNLQYVKKAMFSQGRTRNLTYVTSGQEISFIQTTLQNTRISDSNGYLYHDDNSKIYMKERVEVGSDVTINFNRSTDMVSIIYDGTGMNVTDFYIDDIIPGFNSSLGNYVLVKNESSSSGSIYVFNGAFKFNSALNENWNNQGYTTNVAFGITQEKGDWQQKFTGASSMTLGAQASLTYSADANNVIKNLTNGNTYKITVTATADNTKLWSKCTIKCLITAVSGPDATLTPFSITYNNTKDANNNNPQTFTLIDNLTLSDLTSDDYTFVGWYDSSTDYTDEHLVTGWTAGTVTNDVSLWAKWAE